MLEVRIHGRGGQGAVTAAELLSVAAFLDGKHAQAFPSFGAERMGAPVTSFCRIDDRTIRTHEPVLTPDVVVVQDPTLVHSVNVLEGLSSVGFVLVNTSKPLDHLHWGDCPPIVPASHLCAVPANEIATRLLGRALPNAVLLGALAALTGAVSLASLDAAIRERFRGAISEANCAAASEGFRGIGASPC